MKLSRKNKIVILGIISTILLVLLATIVFTMSNRDRAFAANNETIKDTQSIESVTRGIFGDKKII